jgi:hypothetical protein
MGFEDEVEQSSQRFLPSSSRSYRTNRAAFGVSMIGACSTASFGSCVRAHHGAICRFAMAHAPPATTVSSDGEGRSMGPDHGFI